MANIKITKKDGIVLKTKGKYCPDDIVVTVDESLTPSTLQEKTITANGSVTPDSGYDGFSKVTVNVRPKLQSKTVTENGTVTPSTGYDGLSKVVVNVPATVPNLQEKTTSQNGEVVADSGYDGLSKVTVNVVTSSFAVEDNTLVIISDTASVSEAGVLTL